MWKVEQYTLEYFILSSWIPSLLTVIIGAVLASFFIPRVQAHYAAARTFAERKVQLAGDTAVGFQRYIVAWRRVRQISESNQLSDDEAKRKNALVDARNERRDKLLETLCLARIHFSSGAASLIDEFTEWDEGYTVTPLSKLPDLGDWRKWGNQIAERLNKEARPRRRVSLRSYWRSLLPRSRRKKRRQIAKHPAAAQ